jgi:glycosyltransferase involved in cell wall biosynthesis
MDADILISVVIPVFNRESTISYCLDSVLSQTHKNLEVIVVDDCSTDGTVSVVRSYSDPRVRCVTLDRRSGAQAARNRGIFEAKSEWIAFQDSDDEWLPDKLEKQVSALAAAHYDPWTFIYTNAFRFDPATGQKSLRLLPVVEGRGRYTTLLQEPAPPYPTIIASKKALEKIEYLDERVPSFQEWDTSIRLAKYCRIIHLKEPLLIYHVGKSDAISGNGMKHVEGWHYIINKYKTETKELCGEEAWRKLNIELLRRCLNFGLVGHYDRYKAEAALSDNGLHMRYLAFCRKYGLRADSILYRFASRFFPNLTN